MSQLNAEAGRCTTPDITAALPALRPLLDALDRVEGCPDLKELERILRDLSLGRGDVEGACEFGDTNYRRLKLRETDEYELLLLCWRPGQQSSIHDHAGSACAFRVVSGTATEIRFRRVVDTRFVVRHNSKLFPAGSVCCAADTTVHQIMNESGAGEELITLHLYSPPLRMNVYQEALGRGTAV